MEIVYAPEAVAVLRPLLEDSRSTTRFAAAFDRLEQRIREGGAEVADQQSEGLLVYRTDILSFSVTFDGPNAYVAGVRFRSV